MLPSLGLALAVLLAAGAARAIDVPALDARVVDRAQVLSASTRGRLEAQLAEYERTTGHQIVVLTTPSLEGLEIEDYSIAVADAWRVGHAGLDNGVIFTIAPNERKVRIEVGYGLEGVIPDAIASRIIREAVLPAFRDGDLEGGVLAGVGLIARAAAGEVIPESQRPQQPRRSSRRGGGGFPWMYLLVLLVFGWRGLFFLPFLGGLGGRRGGFGGGGFGGGGGFSGGGGGFGGGGASGSW